MGGVWFPGRVAPSLSNSFDWVWGFLGLRAALCFPLFSMGWVDCLVSPSVRTWIVQLKVPYSLTVFIPLCEHYRSQLLLIRHLCPSEIFHLAQPKLCIQLMTILHLSLLLVSEFICVAMKEYLRLDQLYRKEVDLPLSSAGTRIMSSATCSLWWEVQAATIRGRKQRGISMCRNNMVKEEVRKREGGSKREDAKPFLTTTPWGN